MKYVVQEYNRVLAWFNSICSTTAHMASTTTGWHQTSHRTNADTFCKKYRDFLQKLQVNWTWRQFHLSVSLLTSETVKAVCGIQQLIKKRKHQQGLKRLQSSAERHHHWLKDCDAKDVYKPYTGYIKTGGIW